VQRRAAVSPALAGELAAMARAASLSGGALAIARGGTLLGSWTYGHASLPFMVPVAQDTLFAVASVAKHATAMGVLKLVDRGVIRLDESIRTYLPVVPQAWGDRTVRSLLTHTSGLPDLTLGPKRMPDVDDPTREQLIERMQFRTPLFAAGEGWSYCNSNYVLLGWLIEDHTGKPFAEALREWVLRPAGAPLARADGPGIVTPKLAEPYVYDDRYWKVPNVQPDKADGAGALQWAIDDIAPWGDALARGRVASPAATAQAFAWSKLASGAEIPYGFGFFLDRVAGHAVQWHNGGAPGTVGMLLRVPAADLTVAVMTNTDTPSRFVRGAAWKAVQAVAPHLAYLDRPALAADPVDARLAALGETPGPLKPDHSFIAPDFAHVLEDATEQRRFASGFTASTRLECIEEYPVAAGRMRRYRVVDGERVDYKLAGFDHQDRLFWLWGC
jgi:D-alanyl-D-alanine carboxypeptidase